MYDLNRSHDGVRRLTLQVQYRLTLEDLATLCTAQCAHDYSGPGDVVRDGAIRARLTSKTAVMKDASACLYSDGLDLPSYKMEERGLEAVREIVLARIEELWGEKASTP
ncbi:MAG: hypothetical protein OEU92_26160 [Alphaproteobacteria bacterium]|nr:hypothetical protein [Alphaproteobacteria bacterium]